MLINAGIVISLVILFYFLGRVADLLISSIKKIGRGFGVKIFFLGLILGLFTSFPELTISLNAFLNNVPSIFLGNLLGGIIVILGLILGASLILNRKITTDGKISRFLPILIYITLPFLFGLDNNLNRIDGIILIAAYIFLLHRLYHQNKNNESETIRFSKKELLKQISLAVLGLVMLVAISNFIIRLTMILIGGFNISIFAIGAALFSIGTNLPEIIITVRSWKQHIKELSISTLIGSAIANPAIIGIFALAKPIYIRADLSYYLLMTFTLVLLGFLLYFYETGKKLTRREGIFLVSIYFLFLVSQIVLLIYLR